MQNRAKTNDLLLLALLPFAEPTFKHQYLSVDLGTMPVYAVRGRM